MSSIPVNKYQSLQLVPVYLLYTPESLLQHCFIQNTKSHPKKFAVYRQLTLSLFKTKQNAVKLSSLVDLNQLSSVPVRKKYNPFLTPHFIVPDRKSVV